MQPMRPTKCTDIITSEICYRIAGGESLRSICLDEHMPDKASVLLWVVTDRVIEGTNGKFSDQYHASREAAGYSHADEALDLRKEIRNGELDPQSAKVILDALKWGAERMSPRRHASRQQVDHTSSDGSMTPGRSLNDFYNDNVSTKP